MPSGFAINKKTADDYVLRSKDGYYPDLLLPVEKSIKLENGCRTLWFEIDSENPLAAGEHSIELTVSDDDTAAGTSVMVEVIDCDELLQYHF